jgi:hypothetical protein
MPAMTALLFVLTPIIIAITSLLLVEEQRVVGMASVAVRC